MARPRIVAVVGNRPQLVKAAPLHAELADRADLVVVDSDQHYEPALQQVFYDELGLAPAAHRLGVGSGSHAAMTARVLEGVERVLLAERPDWTLVYGDTNTTLGAALAAAKLGVPVVHVEAGLRSFDRRMPEEVNRVVVDHLARLLCCPSPVARANLAAEGVTAGVHVTGDVMVDAARRFGPLAAERVDVAARFGVAPGAYAVATVHRAASTEPGVLARIVAALGALDLPVLLPLHPRTRAALAAQGLAPGGAVRLLEPLGYLEFTALLVGARILVTDSGGAQKEAYLHGVPCATLREETEWVETVDEGWNVLVGTDAARIAAAVAAPPAGAPSAPRAAYGDGRAAARIATLLAP